MPPNEIDSVWYTEIAASSAAGNKFYFGHIFLIGIQKLNVLAELSGFELREILPVRVNYAALTIFLFAYPFLVVRSLLTYRRAVRKCEKTERRLKKPVYWEAVKQNLDPRILLGGHLFLKFEKIQAVEAAESSLQGVHKSAGFQT